MTLGWQWEPLGSFNKTRTDIGVIEVKTGKRKDKEKRKMRPDLNVVLIQDPQNFHPREAATLLFFWK